jgi:guanine deaminase
MNAQIIRGPVLNPHSDGAVTFLPDGALMADSEGRIAWMGAWSDLASPLGAPGIPVTRSAGIITPPFLDAHTHIPQHPIRGRFTEGIGDNPVGGRLLAGLQRNVFPREARCADEEHAAQVVRAFHADAVSHGVVGGSAYMTVHVPAVRAALEILPPTWLVGLVLMNQNCPHYLRTDVASLESDVSALARDYGRRLVLTDRFAVSVNSDLRRQAAALAGRLGLRMQTHLGEQWAEKALVEKALYPGYASYTDVYRRDGLLDHAPLLAHCIRLTGGEWDILRQKDVAIAHCPTSNTLIGSGIMPLATAHAWQIPYALCTDVGASPTTSLLCEMAQFLKVHAGRSPEATPQEALYRATLAPARILGLDQELGSFEVGKPLSFVEIAGDTSHLRGEGADVVILEGLLDTPAGALSAYAARNKTALDRLEETGLQQGLDLEGLTRDVEETARRLDQKVLSVTLAGKTVWRRETRHTGA